MPLNVQNTCRDVSLARDGGCDHLATYLWFTCTSYVKAACCLFSQFPSSVLKSTEECDDSKPDIFQALKVVVFCSNERAIEGSAVHCHISVCHMKQLNGTSIYNIYSFAQLSTVEGGCEEGGGV